jgi:hypothetical protein
MLEKTFLVVSDKFHHFATRKDVITKSQLCSLLFSENVIFTGSNKIHLIPGQGFSEKALNEIIESMHASKNARYLDFSMWHNAPKRASKQLTHKHNLENILISTPERQSDKVFVMDMLIDEECEMMRDHQTGLHIQGMILVEAARQASMSVIEKFLINHIDEKLYFVFNNLTVNYNKFAFPLPSSLKVSIQKRDETKEKRRHYVMNVDVIQCGNVSASLSLDGTMMSDKVVLNMESRFANQSLDEYINYATSANHANQIQGELNHA